MFRNVLPFILIATTLPITSGALSPAIAEDLANGAKVFRKCRACHDAGPIARNKVGPVLNGVHGRAAGSFPNFNYSKAMRVAGEKGLVWDDVTLNGYIEAPTTYLPKNKMAFTGIKDEAERADLIAYLKTLK
ncbi:MAG: c-type cytochrome [Hyphomicrobiaceae bacterium]